MLIWFQFLAIKKKKVFDSSDHNQLNKTTTVKALFRGRCQKSQNPWPDSELPCANQYSLNVWNKNWKKKTFWSTLTWSSIWGVGATFFFEHLIAVFCYLLSFCYLLAEWLAVNTTHVHRPDTWACVFSMKVTVVTAERGTHFLIFPPQCCDKIQRNSFPCTEMFLVTLYLSMKRNMVPFFAIATVKHTHTLYIHT